MRGLPHIWREIKVILIKLPVYYSMEVMMMMMMRMIIIIIIIDVLWPLLCTR